MTADRTAPGSSGQPPPTRSTTAAIVRLAVAVAAIAAVFLFAGLGDLLLVIVALVIIVVFHELGHYLTAKASHMKVTEFFIGFGPRLWSVRKGETEYGLKPILAGAYVKIPGMTNLEDVDPADEPRAYRQQPFHRRILVAGAGSIMHYVMAFLLAWVAVVAFGTPSKSQVLVAGFVKWPGHPQTAAQAAGLATGERIVSVDGKRISTPTALAGEIEASQGKAVTMVVTDHGRRSTKVVHPVAGYLKNGTTEVLGTAKGKKTTWLVGVETEIAPLFVSENPLAAVASAGDDVGHVTSATVIGIGRVFSPGGISALYDQVTNPQTAAKAAKNPESSSRVMSIVEATRLATQAEQAGVYYFLSVLIALNIVLGLMNMLPMLPLDGGHVAIAVYERVRTRKGQPYYHADAAKLVPVAYAFMAILLVIVGSAVFLDIAHPVANPFG